MTDSDHERDAKPGERRAGLRLPRDGRIDSTAALLAKPYDYVRETCARFGSDLFEARLLLCRTTCMRGPEATALFYDESRFKRHGATPEPVRATLLGKGGVQGLDDQAHRTRKAMFMSLMDPERIAKLAELVEREVSSVTLGIAREALVVRSGLVGRSTERQADRSRFT